MRPFCLPACCAFERSVPPTELSMSSVDPRPREVARFFLSVAVLLAIAPCATAQQTPTSPPAAAAAATKAQATPQQLETVRVQGNYDNAVGTSDAASAGTVTAKLIENRPTLRPGEVLEFVPGVIVTQHCGDGKANQYFLRGFNLDHGTDFATFVDGMPVNMPTHAHGQGYTDLNFLIPELVDRHRLPQGPVLRRRGRLLVGGRRRASTSSTGCRAASRHATLGQDRLPARAARRLELASATGKLLYALEAAHNDGPWDVPGEACTHATACCATRCGDDAQRLRRSPPWPTRPAGTRPTRSRCAPSTAA